MKALRHIAYAGLICVSMQSVAMTPNVRTEPGERYVITPAGQELFKALTRRDKMVEQLPNGPDGLEGLNEIFKKIVKGPLVLVLKWNDGIITAWRKANSVLGAAAKQKTCDDIDIYIDDTPPPADADFFENLAAARGCD